MLLALLNLALITTFADGNFVRKKPPNHSFLDESNDALSKDLSDFRRHREEGKFHTKKTNVRPRCAGAGKILPARPSDIFFVV